VRSRSPRIGDLAADTQPGYPVRRATEFRKLFQPKKWPRFRRGHDTQGDSPACTGHGAALADALALVASQQRKIK
jgi:hypothetical protein